jgi:uncharacterized protein (DUF1697 family)
MLLRKVAETALTLGIWLNTPTVWTNTAVLTTTEDCTYADAVNTVIKSGNTVAYAGTSTKTEVEFLSEYEIEGTFEAEYNFELETSNGI